MDKKEIEQESQLIIEKIKKLTEGHPRAVVYSALNVVRLQILQQLLDAANK